MSRVVVTSGEHETYGLSLICFRQIKNDFYFNSISFVRLT